MIMAERTLLVSLVSDQAIPNIQINMKILGRIDLSKISKK